MTATHPDTPDTPVAQPGPATPGVVERFNVWAREAPVRWTVGGFWWVVDTVRAWPRAGLVAWWLIWSLTPIPRFEPSWGWSNVALVALWPITWEIGFLARDKWRQRNTTQHTQLAGEAQATWGMLTRPRVGGQP